MNNKKAVIYVTYVTSYEKTDRCDKIRSLAWSISAGYTNTQKATRLAPSQKLNSRENRV